MALFRCIKDNYYDGIQGYRTGIIYELPSNPSASLFESVSAAEADRIIVGGTALPAHLDREGDQHIHDPIQFEEDATFNKDVFFDNIIGDAGIQKFVAWNGGTGLVEVSLPGITKTDDTEFTLHSGSANFLDLSDPNEPTITHIHWDDITGIIDPYVATNLRTIITVDVNGDVNMFPDSITSAEARDYTQIGFLTHTDFATITQVNLIPVLSINPTGTLGDLCKGVGFINLEGSVFSGASSTINSLAVTAGRSFSCGRNYLNDIEDPNVTATSAESPIASFFTAYRDGSGGATIGAASTVDSTKYDDGTGTLGTLSDGFWVTHRLYRSTTTGNSLLIFGQATHKGRTEALLSIATENFAVPPGAEQLLLRGYLSIRKGAAGLQDVEMAVFTPADKWGIAPANRPTNGFSTGVPSFKDYSFTSRGVVAGTYYVGGYYSAPTADANLTQASLTISYGTANASYAAHPFIVAGGAGTVDTGQVGLRANFTRIQDDGTRTTSFTEVFTDDITTLSLNDYIEVNKCLGPVQYELYVVSGSPTAYSLDFNYGLAKYEDFGNRNFMVTDFECTGIGGATDTSAYVALLHHTDTGWTYAATGFVPGNGTIVDINTDHSTDDNVINGEPFAYKRADINFPVVAAGPNGIMIEVIATANNTYQILNAHVGVEF